MAADGSVVIEILGDAKQFKNTLQNIAATSLKGLTTSIAAVGTALTGLGVGAVKAGVDFESAFAGVVKTVNATDAELASLREGILDLSTEMPQSGSAIAGVAEAAGQLGIATDNILGFTKTMVQLGDATNLSAEEAASTLARFANITGMSQAEFDRLGSTIVALGNNMATTEAEIAAMGMRIAGAGAQVNMSEDQILSFAAALSSLGIEAEAGGSAFSTLISKMALAIETGNSQLDQFAEVSGLSIEAFSAAFEQDAAGAIISFIDGLAKLEESGGSAIAVLDDMKLSDIRMRDALLRAAGGVEIFNDALNIGNEAWKQNTALAKEAAARYETVESRFSMLQNQITNLGIAIYDGLREPLVNAMTAAGDFAVHLTSAFQTGGLTGLVSELGTVFAEIVTQISAQAPLVIDAGVQMISSFLTGIQQNLPLIADGAVRIVSSFASGIIKLLPQLADTAAAIIIELGNQIIANAPQMVPAAVRTIAALVENLTANLSAVIEVGIQVITALIQGLIEALPDLIEYVPEIVSNIVNVINDNAPKLIAAGIELIAQLIVGLIQAIPTLVANMPKIISAIADTIMAFNWLNLGKNVITAFKNGIAAARNLVKQSVTNIVNTIKTSFSSLPSQLLQVGKDIVRGLLNGIKSMGSWLKNQVANFCGGIVSTVKSAFDINSPSKVFHDEIGVMLARGLASGIEDGTSEAVRQAEVLAERVKNAASVEAQAKLTASQDSIMERLRNAVEAETVRISANLSSTSNAPTIVHVGSESESLFPNSINELVPLMRSMLALMEKGQTITVDKRRLGSVAYEAMQSQAKARGLATL